MYTVQWQTEDLKCKDVSSTSPLLTSVEVNIIFLGICTHIPSPSLSYKVKYKRHCVSINVVLIQPSFHASKILSVLH